jgi:hypothetical protein
MFRQKTRRLRLLDDRPARGMEIGMRALISRMTLQLSAGAD